VPGRIEDVSAYLGGALPRVDLIEDRLDLARAVATQGIDDGLRERVDPLSIAGSTQGRQLARQAAHVIQLPSMAVQVLEPMSVHEAVVFRLAGRGGAGGQGLGHQAINFLAALASQANPHFDRFTRVGDLLAVEGFEERLRHQHGVDAVFGNDHQRDMFI
jgi:hypothetical protein